jgi:predicted DNA-binding transcriptional regulator YafY
MNDFKLKFKRQFEILGFSLNYPSKFKIADFEDLYDVNSLTIKRDLQELRSLGIDIHSKKNKGISVLSDIKDEVIKNIIIHYTGISVNQSSYDKATNFLISKHHSTAIPFITILQRSIENGNYVKIEYEKIEEKQSGEHLITEERIVAPYCIFQSDMNWRLLAKHESVIKQFIISKIKSVEEIDKKFKQVTQKEIEEIFSSSFRSWLGNERYKVKLKLIPPWSERIKPNMLMEFQKITEEAGNSIIYETVVNSLKEIASWIVSRGEGVIVLEPEELRSLVIKTAQGVLKNYD